MSSNHQTLNTNHSHAVYSSQNTTALQWAFFLNLAFAILEIIGGLWTNSLAILSDALHDLGDSLTLGLSWYLERISNRSSNRFFTYGYRRFSLLAALLSTLVLISGGLVVLAQALPRLLAPQHSDAQGMLIFALVGIAVNGFAALRLRKSGTMNARVVAWHLFEDVLGWVAVLVVSITLMFWDIHILDPALSILITCYVLWNVIRNFRKTLALFLQAVPEGVDLPAIEHTLLGLPGVLSAHHTHVWSLDGEKHVLTAHVVVDDHSSKEQILAVKSAIRGIADRFHLVHTTLEVEYESEDCHMKSSDSH
jgi:cobalt-zinc-cadmium efflux system protein